MLGETGRQVMGPIHGSGDFLAYGSPSISAGFSLLEGGEYTTPPSSLQHPTLKF